MLTCRSFGIRYSASLQCKVAFLRRSSETSTKFAKDQDGFSAAILITLSVLTCFESFLKFGREECPFAHEQRALVPSEVVGAQVYVNFEVVQVH